MEKRPQIAAGSEASYFDAPFGTIHPVVSDTEAPRVIGYEPFFGFVEPPFSLSVNTRFRFASASHQAALSQVTYALERREPVVVVTGDIGMGKTLLCRTVVEGQPRKTFLSVITDPLLAPDDALKRILQDFGVISTEIADRLETSRPDLVRALEQFLSSLAQLDAHAVVIVDEAHHLRPEVLEQIRLLANIHDDRGTLLQIVLVGQPDLQTLLASPEVQALRQRVSRMVSLSALTDEEVRRYIVHRLVVAREPATDSPIPGAHDLARAIAEWNESGRPATFTDQAIRTVSQLSHGVPRLVNLLCDRGLEAAYERDSRIVDVADIHAAARFLQLADRGPSTEPPPHAGPSRVRQYVGVAVAALLAGAIIWIGGRSLAQARHGERRLEPSASAAPQNPASAIGATAPPASPAKPPGAASPPAGEPVVNESSRPPVQGAAAESAADTFQILIASFRTEARATDVTGQLTALGHPVHQTAIGGWQQVIAGPFASRTAAEDAQRRLEREGFTGTRIIHETR